MNAKQLKRLIKQTLKEIQGGNQLNEKETCCNKDWNSICCRKLRFGKGKSATKKDPRPDNPTNPDKMNQLNEIENCDDLGNDCTVQVWVVHNTGGGAHENRCGTVEQSSSGGCFCGSWGACGKVGVGGNDVLDADRTATKDIPTHGTGPTNPNYVTHRSPTQYGPDRKPIRNEIQKPIKNKLKMNAKQLKRLIQEEISKLKRYNKKSLNEVKIECCEQGHDFDATCCGKKRKECCDLDVQYGNGASGCCEKVAPPRGPKEPRNGFRNS